MSTELSLVTTASNRPSKTVPIQRLAILLQCLTSDSATPDPESHQLQSKTIRDADVTQLPPDRPHEPMPRSPSAPKPPLWPTETFTRLGPFATRPGQPIRPLRITVDQSDCDRGSDSADEFSWALVLELAALPDLDTASTVPGDHQWLDVALDTPADSYTVTRRDAKGEPTRWTGIDEWEFWQPGSPFPRGGHLYRKLALAAAHASAKRDLFVSGDPLLLAERQRLDRANIVHPAEALPLIHLHLRMREQFAYRQTLRVTFTMDRGMFFLVALRERVPGLWDLIRRTSSIPALNDRLLRLGNAVRSKCMRCLEARDELALLFYATDTDHDRREYHFTYILLLLSGALDALAKLAYLVHEPSRSTGASGQRRASFRSSDFRKQLGGWGARSLVDIVTRRDFEQFCELVWRPRNRIHAEEYTGILYASGLRPQALISVDAEDRAAIAAAAEALGGSSCFGLMSATGELSFEPYVYALEILQRGFVVIEEIACAIDLARHPGYDAAAERPEKPPSDRDPFAPDTLRRVRCFAALDLALDIRCPTDT